MRCIFALLLLFCSCSTRSSEGILLFNGYSFHLESGEALLPIDSAGKEPYMRDFNNIDDIQVPLYRIVSGQGYLLYIGIPFHTSLKKIAAARLALPKADTVLLYTETAEYLYRKYRKGSLYCVEYLRNLDSMSMVSISASTPDVQIADTLLNEQKLSARIGK